MTKYNTYNRIIHSIETSKTFEENRYNQLKNDVSKYINNHIQNSNYSLPISKRSTNGLINSVTNVLITLKFGELIEENQWSHINCEYEIHSSNLITINRSKLIKNQVLLFSDLFQRIGTYHNSKHSKGYSYKYILPIEFHRALRNNAMYCANWIKRKKYNSIEIQQIMNKVKIPVGTEKDRINFINNYDLDSNDYLMVPIYNYKQLMNLFVDHIQGKKTIKNIESFQTVLNNYLFHTNKYVVINNKTRNVMNGTDKVIGRAYTIFGMLPSTLRNNLLPMDELDITSSITTTLTNLISILANSNGYISNVEKHFPLITKINNNPSQFRELIMRYFECDKKTAKTILIHICNYPQMKWNTLYKPKNPLMMLQCNIILEPLRQEIITIQDFIYQEVFEKKCNIQICSLDLNNAKEIVNKYTPTTSKRKLIARLYFLIEEQIRTLMIECERMYGNTNKIYQIHDAVLSCRLVCSPEQLSEHIMIRTQFEYNFKKIIGTSR